MLKIINIITFLHTVSDAKNKSSFEMSQVSDHFATSKYKCKPIARAKLVINLARMCELLYHGTNCATARSKGSSFTRNM